MSGPARCFFLTDDLRLVFFADVRNAALTSLGQMVLSMDLKKQPKPCPGDADTDGDVDADDLTNRHVILRLAAVERLELDDLHEATFECCRRSLV